MLQTWRWFGPDDPVNLENVRQAGAAGVVSALHHMNRGEVWSEDELLKRRGEIEAGGLVWSVTIWYCFPIFSTISTRMLARRCCSVRDRLFLRAAERSLSNLYPTQIGFLPHGRLCSHSSCYFRRRMATPTPWRKSTPWADEPVSAGSQTLHCRRDRLLSSNSSSELARRLSFTSPREG